MTRFLVRKVAVLGAGVMGAQIAAHLVNVKVPVVLFDLAAKDGPKNGVVLKALDGLKKLKPSPIGVPEDLERLRLQLGEAAREGVVNEGAPELRKIVEVRIERGESHARLPVQVRGRL